MPTITPTQTQTPTIGRTGLPAMQKLGTPVDIAGMTCVEYTDGIVRQLFFTFTNVALTITDALAYLGTKIYDFELCYLNILAAHFVGTLTTTSAIASTLNSGVVVNLGIGTATASNVTLATTMMDILPGSGETPAGFTSSTTINVASAEINMVLAAVTAGAHNAANFNGTVTAKDIYLNLAVATATDIDADATVALNGHLAITLIATNVNP
jgi:3-deoxy-D-arabino-heptulosonate 7-phosphate (DAHP) synthase